MPGLIYLMLAVLVLYTLNLWCFIYLISFDAKGTPVTGLSHCILFIYLSISIYLTMPGLSCSTRDLRYIMSLQCRHSLVVVCGLGSCGTGA